MQEHGKAGEQREPEELGRAEQTIRGRPTREIAVKGGVGFA